MVPVFAVVDLSSPICSDIVRIFNTRHLPLESPRLQRRSAPGLDDAYFFQVDWRKFTQQQLSDWAAWMARRFDLSPEQVLKDLKDPTHGMPLLASHVLTLDPPGTVIERPVPRSSRSCPDVIDMRMIL